MRIPMRDLIDYGRYVLGYRDPESLGRFIDVIQMVDIEIVGT